MTRTIEHMTSEIRASDSQKGAKLAGKIFEKCKRDPAAIDPSEAVAIYEALTSGSRTVQLKLSGALFDVAKADGEVLVPVASDILEFLHREEPCSKVRTNLGRPIGDAVAADPSIIDQKQIPTLSTELDYDEKWYRHSIAWTLELLAFVRPNEVFPHRDGLLARLDDRHPPVVKHACRALALLERYQSFLERTHLDQISDHLDHEEPAVRTAASLALGAHGGPTSITHLEDRCEIEQDKNVQVDIRQALREASFPSPDEVISSGPVKSLHEDDWIAVETRRVAPRTGRFRGKVTAVTARGDGGTDPPQKAILENPYEGYELALEFDGDTIRATYSDRRRSDELVVTVDRLVAVDSDHLPLLYAHDGDKLDAKLDRSSFSITVEKVTHVKTGKRVVGTDTSNQTIEFRPCEPHPLLARFHEGRCFESHDVSLQPKIR